MTTDELLDDLWQNIDAGRGQESVSNLVRSWVRNQIKRHEVLTPDLLYAIAEKRLGWPGGEYATPKSLTSFIVRLAALRTAQNILDPTCGLGVMLKEVAMSVGAHVIHGIDINKECCDVATAVLGSQSIVIHGDALASPESLLPTYDLIVANPPFGMKLRGRHILPQLGNNYHGDISFSFAVWACARLSESGRAMVIVTHAFPWSRPALEAQAAIKNLGCRISALIHLPGGTFPQTGISSYLAVFERGEQHEVFIGEFSKGLEHQKWLVTNYKRRKGGEQPSEGRLCPLSSFRGFEAFASQERLKRLVQANGWQQFDAKSVISSAQVLNPSDSVIDKQANGLFLYTAGTFEAALELNDVPRSRLRNYVHFEINPEIADSRYLVHWFNQSQVGQTTLVSASRGVGQTRLDLDALLATHLSLPPLPEQRDVIKGIEHLDRVRAEATELETALWSSAEAISVVVAQIVTINQEDRYEDWIETLPFPLASILWRHHAVGESPREKYEILLHFFEATAAFVATIHLSAFMTDDSLWGEASQGLRQILDRQGLSLERATFGTWKTVVEYLSGRCKNVAREDEGLGVLARVYGATNHNHIAMLYHPELLSAFQRANHLRNNSSGHAGAIGLDDAQIIHDELLALVQKVRGVFGRLWLNYELIQPSEYRYHGGGIYRNKVRRLMGTRSSPFEVVERQSSNQLISDRLYLFDTVSQTGTLLRPLIQVMPSPKKKATGCFIFSRRMPEGTHFVSFHLEEESSFDGIFSDVEETFQRIHIFDQGAN